ncbi:hypothetical protein ACC724_39635, partial [Rhizobium ruizarguesonis]
RRKSEPAAALVELVKAKIEGWAPQKKKQPPERKVVDLMEALRQSAKMGGKAPTKKALAKKTAPADGCSRSTDRCALCA